jgi:asparagine synthase (glutamine-hydrolysing)
MYRFAVLVWNPEHAQASAVAADLQERFLTASRHSWRRAIECEGLAVLHAGVRFPSSLTMVLSDDAGAVMGRVFRRDADPSAPLSGIELDAAQSGKIVATRGAHLLERYFGRYVAVIRDPADGSVRILRDPSGAMPCFLSSYRGVTIAFSDVEDCLALRVMRFTVNWAFVAAFVPYSSLQVRDTGLNEVTELQPGEMIRIDRGVLERCFRWNPFEVARGDRIEDVDTAIHLVHRTVRHCVQAWASVHPVILHNLSGGLDSSIVLSCLRDAPTRPLLACINYFATGRHEDERKYARLAAGSAEVELIEQQHESEQVNLRKLFEVRRAPRPWFYMYDLESGPLESRLAAERGITGIFSGAGGDALFFQNRADLAVVDHLFEHPLSGRLPGVALDAARVSRSSMWPLLRAAFAQRVTRRGWSPLSEVGRSRSLIRPEVVASARANRELLHPWLEKSAGALPGVLWQVMSMSVPPSFYDSFDHETMPERVVPLMSQPLIELCLRIPTYVSITGGYDRSVARRAFASEVPMEIIRRRAKGGVTRHNTNMLDANLEFIREVLLEGLLVREGLLDRGRLEHYLSRETSPADFEYHEILHQHLCAEVWLQRWH